MVGNSPIAFLTTIIESKRLKFSEEKNGKKGKCYRLHVGNKTKKCAELKVHDKPITDVDELVYLGEVLTSDGKNKRNIQSKVNQGIGMVGEIMEMLNKMNLGPHYFDVAILMRNAYLVNSMLFNVDALPNLSSEEIEELSRVDRFLLC